MKTCIAIDDEPLALEVIETYVGKLPFIQFLKSFTNPLEALTFIQSNEVDLVFLDIEMEELTGLQMLEMLRPRSGIIFTTAHDTYAIKGFEHGIVDYLLKPFSFERFVKAVQRVAVPLSPAAAGQPVPERSYLFVKSENTSHRIDLDDILVIEGMREYLKIQRKQDAILTLQTFDELLKKLPISNFIRVHRSYIVAIDKIDKIERNRIYIGSRTIPLSDKYREGVKLFLGLQEGS